MYFLAVSYFGIEVLGKSQGFLVYRHFIQLQFLFLVLRRIKVKPTKYIKYQTWSLILIQALPLFILPEFVFPFLGKIGAFGR